MEWELARLVPRANREDEEAGQIDNDHAEAWLPVSMERPSSLHAESASRWVHDADRQQATAATIETLPVQVILSLLLWISARDLCAVASSSPKLRFLPDEPAIRELLIAWLQRRRLQADFCAWQRRQQCYVDIQPASIRQFLGQRNDHTADEETVELSWEVHKRILCDIVFILQIVGIMTCSLLFAVAFVFLLSKALCGLRWIVGYLLKSAWSHGPPKIHVV
mmetsp:Transcript_31671/g.62206  ORF Transcript_31671/g.62206 Transcript_31671/m.62206 type:complete len:222 (+) Transcript_31671:128-793(+)